MDIGKILRDKAKFPAYRSEPKTKNKRWGIFPSVKVEQLIFYEDDDFYCPVKLFSYDRDEIEKMQDDTIKQAHEGMKKDGWTFWLHAANHKIQRIGKLYCSEINFCFKVRIPDVEEIQTEVK